MPEPIDARPWARPEEETTELQDLLNTFIFFFKLSIKKDIILTMGRPKGKALILCGSEKCLGCIDVAYRQLVGSGNNWAACGCSSDSDMPSDPFPLSIPSCLPFP